MTTEKWSREKGLCLTLGLMLVYIGLHYIPLPTVLGLFRELPGMYKQYPTSLGILALGLGPIAYSFLYLEIFSLILKPLARWRLEGRVGREKLNQWAWGLSLLIVFIQSWGNSYMVLRLIGEDSKWATAYPGWLFHILNISTVMAGTFLAVFIARVITEKGLGNGFLALIVATNFKYIIFDGRKNLNAFFKTNPTSDQKFQTLWLGFILLLVLFYLWKFISRDLRLPIRLKNGKRSWYEVSPFPSGAALQGYVFTLIGSINSFFLMGGIHIQWINSGWPHMALELVCMTLMGYFCYTWFWNGSDLFGSEVENLPALFQKREKILDRRFYKGMIVLLGSALLFWIPLGPAELRSLYWIVDFSSLLWILCYFQDLLVHWDFWGAYGEGVEIMEIDNVHLASYLKGLFAAEDVPCHLQSYSFRRLMFWSKPLFKIRLLVPEKDRERALGLLATVQYKVV